MAWFSARVVSAGSVRADRSRVWRVLTDPDVLPRLTPFLTSIETDGDLWRWQLTRVPILGTSVVPAFTERMRFEEPGWFGFTHEPPPGDPERTGVEGWYSLDEVADGTRLGIDIEVRLQLPMTRLAAPAVSTAMKAVMVGMGARFSANLARHLQEVSRRRDT